MSWREIELGQAIHVKHGFAFKGEFFDDVGDHIVLTPGNFHEDGGFRLRPGKDRAYVGDIPEGYVLSESNLIVAMTEQGPGLLGSSALIPESDRFLHNQRLGLVDDIDRRQLDKIFLYYLFNTRPVRGQISGSASGTKVRHTSPERIYRVRVRVPDVPMQERIAETLSAYDDLIDNNLRRIALLEEGARELFREWFVRLRFPGHEHTRIINGVPEGWERRPIAELTTLLSRGIAPHYDDSAEGLVINQKCIRNGRIDLNLARHQSREFRSDRQVQRGDVLINSTGEGTLGRVAQVLTPTANCTVDSHVTIARPMPELGIHHFGLAVLEWEPRFSKMGRGATNQTELSPSQIGEAEMLVPAYSVIQQFEAFAAPLFDQVSTLTEQNQRLGAARDLLLPRLMNGELAV
jgi:type I restriction enzyme S subunit